MGGGRLALCGNEGVYFFWGAKRGKYFSPTGSFVSDCGFWRGVWCEGEIKRWKDGP